MKILKRSLSNVPVKMHVCRACNCCIFEGDKYEAHSTNDIYPNYFCEDCAKKSVLVYQPRPRGKNRHLHVAEKLWIQ